MREKTNPSYIKRYALILVVAWSIIIFTLLFWATIRMNEETIEYAHIYTNAALQKDLLYRRWATMHGGLYVPVTNLTPPNPYLSDIPERDIITPSGKQLTLINPAYMSHQVYNFEKEVSETRSHLTSLIPIKPENAPDDWEKKALVAFEQGEIEMSTVEYIEGREYFRLMRPFVTEQGCLKCHAWQGYKLNDIRGGLSVSMPMDSIRELAGASQSRRILIYILIWLIGIFGLVIGYFQVNKTESKRIHAEMELKTAYLDLENKTVQLSKVNEELNKHHEHLEEMVKERTTALEIARDRALESDRLKSAFLGTMSHELRTPLNSIIGFTGILLEGFSGPINNEQKKQLEIVKKSANHLLSLIIDILDVSKIESGKLKINITRFNMNTVITWAIQSVKSLADEKGLSLHMEVDTQAVQIESDQKRVEQVIINLLNNAIKFTEKGEVRVECHVSDGQVITRIIDTGIGIKPEHMDRLFKPFIQIDDALSRRYEGTGLGLSICKKFVEMLGGRISAESKFGKGSVFTFTLPLKMEAT